MFLILKCWLKFSKHKFPVVQSFFFCYILFPLLLVVSLDVKRRSQPDRQLGHMPDSVPYWIPECMSDHLSNRMPAGMTEVIGRTYDKLSNRKPYNMSEYRAGSMPEHLQERLLAPSADRMSAPMSKEVSKQLSQDISVETPNNCQTIYQKKRQPKLQKI